MQDIKTQHSLEFTKFAFTVLTHSFAVISNLVPVQNNFDRPGAGFRYRIKSLLKYRREEMNELLHYPIRYLHNTPIACA